MHLNRRLLLLTSLVPKDVVVYDIGCDHALLDIFLTLYNNNTCYAIDQKESALKMAKKNIALYHLEKKITVLCQDGFFNQEIKENSVAVLAGMGTRTILDILKGREDAPFKKIIIQTNNDYEILRESMMKKGYKITSEHVLLDKKIWYVIMTFEKGKASYSTYELKFGPLLKKENSIKRNLYYTYLIEKREAILKKLPRGHLGKKLEIKKEIVWLKRTSKVKERK